MPDQQILFFSAARHGHHLPVIGVGQQVRVEFEIATAAELLVAPFSYSAVSLWARVLVEGGPKDGWFLSDLAVLVDHRYDLVGRFHGGSSGYIMNGKGSAVLQERGPELLGLV